MIAPHSPMIKQKTPEKKETEKGKKEAPLVMKGVPLRDLNLSAHTREGLTWRVRGFEPSTVAKTYLLG